MKTLSILVLSQYPNLIQQTILSKKFGLGTEELGLGEGRLHHFFQCLL